MRVAVVEDDSALRELLKIRLEANGFDVFVFDSAESAESMLKSEKVDVALIDANLPGKLGVELALDLKENPDYGNPKVIIVTGVSFSTDDIKRNWKEKYKIDDFIEKPFDFNDILNKIRN